MGRRLAGGRSDGAHAPECRYLRLGEDMFRRIRRRAPLGVLAAAILSTAPMVCLGLTPAQAEVTAVEGSAYGYVANVSLFGGPYNSRGPSPTVTLPPAGSSTRITSSAPTGNATIGPAVFFSSGPITVWTRGIPGADQVVTSKATIQTVNTSQQEVFTASTVVSTCSASETGVTGATAITNGTLQTSEGNPDIYGDETVVAIPNKPAPNTEYYGMIEGVGDSFRYVFNERIVNPDGSITVNAAHQYFLGPTAVGELIIGHVECGVTATDTTSPTVTRTIPEDGSSGIARGANVSAFFSEPMNAATLNTTTVLLYRQGTTTPVPASVTYVAATKRVVLDPNSLLIAGATYRAVVNIGAKDTAGNRLDQDPATAGLQQKRWLFTTAN